MAPKGELSRMPGASVYLEKDQAKEAMQSKTLHRMYHQQIAEVVDIEKFYQWLEKVGIKDGN